VLVEGFGQRGITSGRQQEGDFDERPVLSGIAGVIYLNDTRVQCELMQAMLAPLRRRGPDRCDHWQRDNAGLAQALLATTPEAVNERQPWVCTASGCVVVTDSRLDNRPELAKALQLDQRPLDAVGDAELIHAAFQRWGVTCVERLLGDFAFVIWDPAHQRAFGARDPMGVRPFYFHFSPRLLAFASQPDALLAVPQVPGDLNEGRILDSLVDALEGIDKTSTFFQAIERLPSAHWIELQGDRLQTQRYWRPAAVELVDPPRSEAQWVQGLRERMEVAVRRRCRSHGAVGSMLSGGLDSSSVVAIASDALATAGRAPLHTYSAVSGDPDCAETRAIQSMLAHQRLVATLLDFSAMPDALDAVARDWPHMGEPFDASMTLVACQYQAAAKDGVRVVMDGIDADGLLSEGVYMQQLVRAVHWRALWREAQGQSAFFNGEWSAWSFLRPALGKGLGLAPLRRQLRHWLGHGRRQADAQMAYSLVNPKLALRADLQGRLARLARQNRPADFSGPSQRSYSFMESTYTTAGVERYGRVAAQLGVEPRHPFLDRELVEYCAWLPLNLRLRDGFPKWALRAAMAPWLPESVAWRQGKEHLGWQFNAAVFPRVAAQLPPPWLDRSCLGPYVQLGQLPPWPAWPRSTDLTDPRWESQYNALALAVWMKARKKAVDEQKIVDK
jgi:asparagine synthase (glutamine-hydrolysing)